MNREEYNNEINVGQDCLNPEMKKARIMAKAAALEGKPITDDDILNEALEREENSHFKGLLDPGQPLLD